MILQTTLEMQDVHSHFSCFYTHFCKILSILEYQPKHRGSVLDSLILDSSLIAQKSWQFNEFTILASYILSAQWCVKVLHKDYTVHISMSWFHWNCCEKEFGSNDLKFELCNERIKSHFLKLLIFLS